MITNLFKKFSKKILTIAVIGLLFNSQSCGKKTDVIPPKDNKMPKFDNVVD